MLRLPTLRWLPFLIGSDRGHPPRTGTWHRTPERPILKIRASKLPVRFRPRLCQAIHVHSLEIYQKADGLLPTPRRSEQPGIPCSKSGHPHCIGWPLNVRSRSALPGAARPPRRRQGSAPCSQSWSDQARSGRRGCCPSPCRSLMPWCEADCPICFWVNGRLVPTFFPAF